MAPNNSAVVSGHSLTHSLSQLGIKTTALLCIADLFNSFCEEVYVVAFFKVVQQQTICKVGNTITCLWADNFCLQQCKNYSNRSVVAKVMLK